MNEIKRIVVEHDPVANLPEELRVGLSGEQTVRVTVEPEGGRTSTGKRRPFTSYLGAGKGAYPNPEDAVSQIRKLRDEWDE